MKTIAEMVGGFIRRGMTSNQAENYACQEIVDESVDSNAFSPQKKRQMK